VIRFAIARQHYNPYGGAERSVAAALSALASQHDVSVTLLAREVPPAAESGHPWTWRRIDPFYIGRTLRERSFRHAVQALLPEFDVLQSHERIPGATIFRAGDGVYASWLAQYAKIRALPGRLSLKFSPYHRAVLRAERDMFAHPSLKCVLCNSRLVRDDIKARFRVADEILHVVYNGVDLDVFTPELRDRHLKKQRSLWGIPQDAPAVAFVGPDFQRKGLQTAIDAIAMYPRVFLLVAGDDAMLPDFELYAAKRNLSSRIRFLKTVDDIRLVYGCADALILPALYDPFPTAALEALASGLPVLTTDTTGVAELLKEGESGWICPALDIAHFQEALFEWQSRWMEHDGRDQLRQAARKTAEPLTITKMTDALTDIYRLFV
jgi:UDP-glucose:(heptosyl)LPS alpha-1,3-glucosyltransferase